MHPPPPPPPINIYISILLLVLKPRDLLPKVRIREIIGIVSIN